MKAEEYAKRIEYIATANQSLVKVDSLELLLPRILEIAEASSGAEASSFLRYVPESGLLFFEVVRNKNACVSLAEAEQGRLFLEPGEGIAGKALQERSTQIFDNVNREESFAARIDAATGYTTKSILCVPVLHMGEPLGVIQLLNPKDKHGFDLLDAKVLEIFASMAAVAIERAKHLQEQYRQRELQGQLELTARIQRCCWPEMPVLGHGSHVWGRSRPARHVGGDIYDVIPLQDGSFILYLADVAGKGVPAGFVMAALWATMRCQVCRDMPVNELLQRLNALTFPFLSGEVILTTICLLRYWPESGRADLALGGHNAPLVLHGAEPVELPRLEGLPLGTVQDCRYASHSLTLPTRGVLLMYSDGVNEAFSPDEKMFGLERLQEVARKAPRLECGDRVFQALDVWSAGAGQSDDATLLMLWRE